MQATAPPAAVALLAMLAAGSLVTWPLIVRQVRRGEPLVPPEPRRPVPWGGAEVLLIVAGYFVASGLGVYLAASELLTAPAQPFELSTLGVALSALFSLAAIAGGALLLRRVVGATWSDLGWSPARLGRDVRIGLLGGLAIFLPVYAIQAVVTIGIGWKSEHGLIVLVERDPSGLVYWLAVFHAVGVAPLAEEFLFRVLLQGWLEAWQTRGRAERQLNTETLDSIAAKRENAESSQVASVDPDNPYAAPLPTTSTIPIERQIDVVAGQLVPGWAPLVTSAVIFALLHATQGPDPIALLPLALVLGYLYRQTHRLVPSLVAHAFLNGTSMLLLWLNLA